jgi:hypothetical protein
MQKLSRNKDGLLPGGNTSSANNNPLMMNPLDPLSKMTGNPNDQPSASTSSRPSNCLLFEGMFDTTQVDLKRDPSFFMDVKDQVLSICTDFGKVERVYVE